MYLALVADQIRTFLAIFFLLIFSFFVEHILSTRWHLNARNTHQNLIANLLAYAHITITHQPSSHRYSNITEVMGNLNSLHHKQEAWTW